MKKTYLDYIEEYGADVLQDEGTRQFVWESKHPRKYPETHWEKWGTGVALVDSDGKVLAVDYDLPDSDGPARPETPDEYRKLDKEVSKLWEESRFKSVKYGSPAYNRVVELLQKSGVAFLAADFEKAIQCLQEAKTIILAPLEDKGNVVVLEEGKTTDPLEEAKFEAKCFELEAEVEEQWRQVRFQGGFFGTPEHKQVSDLLRKKIEARRDYKFHEMYEYLSEAKKIMDENGAKN